MKATTLFFILLLTTAVQANVLDSRPIYEMRGFSTDLWEMDTDYFSPPIVLVRTASTPSTHRITFNVNRYVRYCAYWENRCVQYDSQGRCVRWQQVCGRWDLQAQRVPKRIELNMRKAGLLVQDEQETFELTIDRIRPGGEGEDMVRTWLKEEKVINPVRIHRTSDYSYIIELKK